MAKIKIYEIVKELGESPKALFAKLEELGVLLEAPNPYSAIDTEDAERLRKYVLTGVLNKKKKPKAVKKTETAPPKTPAKKTDTSPKTAAAAEKPEKKVAEKKTVEKKTVEKKTVEKKTAAKDPAAENAKSSRPKKITEKPEEQPAPPKPIVAPPAVLPKPEEIKPAPPPKPVETPPAVLPKPEEIKPAAPKTVEQRPIASKPAEVRPTPPRTDRPQGDNRPRPDRPQGDNRPRPDRPQGDNRPRTDRPQGDRPRTDRPQGDRPRTDRPRTDRPQGDNRPRPDRPQGDNRPRTDRPRTDRPRTDRPQGDNRPRPDRPFAPRPLQAPRPDKPGDTKLRTEKPTDVRPRKKDADKQRPDKDADKRPRKKTVDGRPLTGEEMELRLKKAKTTDTKQKPQGQKPAQGQRSAPQKKENAPKAADIKKAKKAARLAKEEQEANEVKTLYIPKTIAITEFAAMLKISATEIVKELFLKKNMPVNMNQEISYDIAAELAIDRGVLTEEAEEIDLLEQFFAEEDEGADDKNKVTRPPVVVVMGHVDHGKTSLLDAIRDTNVMVGEAGGITQHIGAYTVNIEGRVITFLDTPGHEAFTAMRMRGALITDIAVLVVAADDGVMPQTVEAINHAKAAGVDIIVAINKIDKPGANPERVKQELTEYGLLAEDWGGQTIAVPVSAKNKEGLTTLLEMIILVADMKELRANPNKKARGTVIEAALDKGRGPVATVLIQDGTIKVGDPVVAGSVYGKIRAMTDDKGNKVKEAGPSLPVEILGLSQAPKAGDLFFVAKNDKQARQLSLSVIAKGRVDMLKSAPQKISLDDLYSKIKLGAVKELNIVVKADVQGSVEAVKTSLEKLSGEEVRIKVIHGGVGAVTESDVSLASASNAIIIGFNVRPEATAKSIAETENVDIRLYRIIYNAIEDITSAMKGLLDPVFEEKVIGTAEIRQLFRASGVGTIGGCYVLTGKIIRSAGIRIIRDGKVVYEGTLDALRRFKDDAKEVAAGYECGLTFNKYNDIKEGDIVEAFIMEEIPR